MRVIICGSRSALRWNDVIEAMALAHLFDGIAPSLILSGAARGADAMGEQWAAANRIPVKLYPAQWLTHGRGAGFIRNIEMAENADACVALRMPGISNGTDHMIEQSRLRGLLVYVHRIKL